MPPRPETYLSLGTVAATGADDQDPACTSMGTATSDRGSRSLQNTGSSVAEGGLLLVEHRRGAAKELVHDAPQVGDEELREVPAEPVAHHHP